MRTLNIETDLIELIIFEEEIDLNFDKLFKFIKDNTIIDFEYEGYEKLEFIHVISDYEHFENEYINLQKVKDYLEYWGYEYGEINLSKVS